MFGINELWLFIVSGIILNILPGPDSLYIIGRSASQGFKAVSFILLGIIFNINGMIWCHFLAWSSSIASTKIKQNEAVTKWLHRGAGGLFAYFGVRLAFSEQS
jgi:threonine/homoserine/homoserine lactone efflux protein